MTGVADGAYPEPEPQPPREGETPVEAILPGGGNPGKRGFAGGGGEPPGDANLPGTGGGVAGVADSLTPLHTVAWRGLMIL